MKYCLQCGAELSIDYENKKLICEYCRKEYDYSNDKNEKEYVCLSCDVDFISDKPNLECCPYCNSKNLTVIKLKKNLSVDKLISFTKTQKDFIKKYKKILRKKVFIPNKFYKNKIIKTCNNLYLPYYLCNMHSKAKIYIDTKKINKWISDNYKYNKIDDYALLRYCEADLEDVLVIISNKMDKIRLGNIMPYNFNELIDYNNIDNYIYEDCKKSFEKDKLRTEIENIVIKNIFSRIKDYDSVELKNIQTTVSNFKYKKVLLPLWVLNIEYKNKMYYFIMNGQTGKVYYELPTSKLKIFSIFIVTFIIVFLILVLVRSVL